MYEMTIVMAVVCLMESAAVFTGQAAGAVAVTLADQTATHRQMMSTP